MNAIEPVTFGPFTIAIHSTSPNHALIRRADGGPPEPTWYELQHMKCLAFGSHARAVEVFPAVGKLYDTANIRHLWNVPPGVVVPCLTDGNEWVAP